MFLVKKSPILKKHSCYFSRCSLAYSLFKFTVAYQKFIIAAERLGLCVWRWVGSLLPRSVVTLSAVTHRVRQAMSWLKMIITSGICFC